MFGEKKNLNENLTKKEKIEKLKLKHDPIFDRLGIAEPKFIPKVVFGTPPVLYLFPSELKDEKDLYTEKVDRDYNSEDSERILYRWKFVSNYKTKYQQKDIANSDDSISIIPFADFEPVIQDEFEDEFNLPNPDEDLPISELTIRDLAAIITGKPVSHKSWLNKLLK